MLIRSLRQRVPSAALVALAAMVVFAAFRSSTPVHAGQRVQSPDELTLLSAPDQFFSSGSTRIRYRVVGKGEPVLLLHGYTDRVEMWAAMADSLSRQYQVIVPDVRGFGLSTKFASPSDYGRHMVTDQVALLDHLGIRRSHVVGYSMGAVLAANLATLVPDRITSASLIAGPFFPDSATLARWVEPDLTELERGNGLMSFFRHIMPTWPDSVLAPVANQLFAENDFASLVAAIKAFPGLMIDSTTLSKISIPALAIIGADDQSMLESSAWVAARWRGIKHMVLPRGDHADIFQLPEVISEVRSLLARSTS